MTEIAFQARDGVALNGRIFDVPEPKAAVLLNVGTATQTGFYFPFVRYLNTQGYTVMVWNYRGFCESKSQPLKQARYAFTDIGVFDIPAAIDTLSARYPQLPLLCIGHSVGGQQIGFADNANKLDGLVAVAVSCGYFPYMPLHYRLQALFFFYLFAPISSALLGYVACKPMGLMEDLSAPLAKQWRQWCANEHYFFSEPFRNNLPPHDFTHYDFPIHVFHADDDEISTQRNVDNFWSHVQTKKALTFTRLAACETATQEIGHFGYFKKAHQPIWQKLVQSLDAMVK